MSPSHYLVESAISYRNVLRQGVRGKARYSITVAAQDKIEARIRAESALVALFRRQYGHLEIKTLTSRAAVKLPPGVGSAGTIELTRQDDLR